MAKFLFVYRNNAEQEAACAPSPEEMQAAMVQWSEWFQKVGDAIVDGGDGLLPSGKLVGAGGVGTDGPFVEAKELVGGYSILQADSYDAAAEHAKSCPIVAMDGTVEIRQMAGYTEQ